MPKINEMWITNTGSLFMIIGVYEKKVGTLYEIRYLKDDTIAFYYEYRLLEFGRRYVEG